MQPKIIYLIANASAAGQSSICLEPKFPPFQAGVNPSVIFPAWLRVFRVQVSLERWFPSISESQFYSHDVLIHLTWLTSGLADGWEAQRQDSGSAESLHYSGLMCFFPAVGCQMSRRINLVCSKTKFHSLSDWINLYQSTQKGVLLSQIYPMEWRLISSDILVNEFQLFNHHLWGHGQWILTKLKNAPQTQQKRWSLNNAVVS